MMWQASLPRNGMMEVNARRLPVSSERENPFSCCAEKGFFV